MKDDRINQFIDELNQTIAPNYQITKEIFNREYGYPELDPLRDEICKCLICGLYQAAITLTNHLLESSLKKCLAIKYKIEHENVQLELKDAFKKSIEKYDKMELNMTINQACSQNLISKTQKKRLHKFREDFRNAFSHAESSKIFEDLSIPVNILSIEKNEGPEDVMKKFFSSPNSELTIKDFLPIQGILQAKYAQITAIPYFCAVDKIIRDMVAILDNLINKKQAESPKPPACPDNL